MIAMNSRTKSQNNDNELNPIVFEFDNLKVARIVHVHCISRIFLICINISFENNL